MEKYFHRTELFHTKTKCYVGHITSVFPLILRYQAVVKFIHNYQIKRDHRCCDMIPYGRN